MERIEFVNKVWISHKGTILDKILLICGSLYLVLDIITIIMDGFTFSSLISGVFALALALWAFFNLKTTGHYIETPCLIQFEQDRMIWEYPSIDFENGKGIVTATYYIDYDQIKSVIKDDEMNSICMECIPVVEVSDKKSTKVEENKYKKEFTLITYNYDVEKLADFFEEYANVEVTDF